ncbi:hypothetical protein EP7_001074 [Isosphaeraceae bacterium EP7]
MCNRLSRLLFLWLASHALVGPARAQPHPTREFEIRGDRPFLGGEPIDLWGIRYGNALYSDAVTERHVNNLDNMAAHGVNLLGLYLQGSNGGYPNFDAGLNGFHRDGSLKPAVAGRLALLVREADRRGMVVMVGLFSPRKDQFFHDEAAIKRALREAGEFLHKNGLKNVFVDIMHEYNHPDRIDHEIFREPEGQAKKARLTAWFKEVAHDVEVGVCPAEDTGTADTYPGMDVRIIQKEMPIPDSGFVVNVEIQKQDSYENDGRFNAGHRAFMDAEFAKYLKSPHAVMLFHSAFTQGISNVSGTAPHAEMGGMGTGPDDRGIRFYYEWVRDHVGRYEYPRHTPFQPEPVKVATTTRVFEVRGDRAYLGGEPVKLWGIRCGNALMSAAVTERHIRSLDAMNRHGINLIAVSLQGTEGGFPNPDAGPNAFRADGSLKPEYADRLETLIREADRRGMVVAVDILQPGKVQTLRDEPAIRRAVEEAGRFFAGRRLQNVFVDLLHGHGHPESAHHEILREPDGASKRARLLGWFQATAPGVLAGICPHGRSKLEDGASPGSLRLFEDGDDLTGSGFKVKAIAAEYDSPGNEGVFNAFHREAMDREWSTFLGRDDAALIFRSAFVEGITGAGGTGPNPEIGGDGSNDKDHRGVSIYDRWLSEHVGPWSYPRHGRPGARP